ncbi:hypothetical protein JTB14_009694 [Gonioctena quinquepunctata]|nr:hypothetical protein JTB14_009694 [Gonioctena quinquepunctata]
MGRVILLLVFVGVVFSEAKVERAAWDEFLQVGGDIVVKSNDIQTGRSGGSLEDHVEGYIKSHDVSFDVPMIGSRVTMDAKNLDNTELNLKLKFGSGSEVQERGKKSKLKKIFVPILVFILIKAMTLIPLALGILGLKTWNAIQLSFISFVSSLAMAVWKLCSKVSHPPPQIIHNAWDPHHHHLHDRSDAGQQMPYAAYAPQ